MECSRTAPPNVNSYIRILNAFPKGPNIDIYANGLLIANDIAFSKVSKYFSLVPNNYEIQIYKSGTYDKPLFSKKISLVGKQYYTACVSKLNNDIYLLTLKDGNLASQKTPSFLRFINLSPNSPLLSLSLPNNVTLFDDVEYLETTDYYKLSSGIYNFEVGFASDDNISKFLKNVILDNGKSYTLYIIGLFKDKPRVGSLLVQDVV